MEKFVIGMLLGGVGGALLVTNNYKMRTLVRKSQDEIQAKLDKMLDEKIETVEKGTEKIVQETEKAVDETKKKVKKAVEKADK